MAISREADRTTTTHTAAREIKLRRSFEVLYNALTHARTQALTHSVAIAKQQQQRRHQATATAATTEESSDTARERRGRGSCNASSGFLVTLNHAPFCCWSSSAAAAASVALLVGWFGSV